LFIGALFIFSLFSLTFFSLSYLNKSKRRGFRRTHARFCIIDHTRTQFRWYRNLDEFLAGRPNRGQISISSIKAIEVCIEANNFSFLILVSYQDKDRTYSFSCGKNEE